jgi:outer membrane receptor protein involved in Fe transport
VRINFKHLDDHAPTYLPVPVKLTGDKISELPGIDPRTATFYSPYWIKDVTLDRNNSKAISNVNDGLTAKTDSLGFEAQFKLDGGWTLDEKFRTARNTGRFIGVFPDNNVKTVATTFATGPNAGKDYFGPAFNAVVFNTSFDDLGSTFNDIKMSKSIELGQGSKLNATGGLFNSTQNVAMTWNFNQYLLQAVGEKPALLTAATNGTNAFGGCCSRTIDAQYKTTAPYAALGFETGGLNLDGSIRYDKQFATGTNNLLSLAPKGSTTYDPAAARIIDYNVKHTSYSLGANYRLTKDLALFGRYSNGVAFNGDRLVLDGKAAAVDGSSAIPSNIVKQAELGAKWRSGNLSTFATLFKAKTEESNVDVTQTPIVTTFSTYDAKGLELEAAYRLGGFRLAGGATYTNAKIVDSSNTALVGKAPQRQAKYVYQLTPSYSFTDSLAVGASIVGNTSSKDASPAGPLTVTLPGFTVVNAFANYQANSEVMLSLGVNNLTNTIGYTESNDGREAARSINGRTVKGSLKYSF